MQFVSYAQNFEDVILWRILKHISFGCYVDIGAQDPIVDSVSMAFYEHDWRGVHVEPNRHYAERLRSARPDERVIEAAVGTSAETITFFEIPHTGLSTGDPVLAEEHQKEGFTINRVDVPCVRLSHIFDESRFTDIHWLKIDVEGMEGEVIASWKPSAIRPWIVVVESTKPNTTTPNFSLWENLLLDLDYEFVYFDGLNRFYLHHAHSDLKKYFGPGPNVFDDFILSGRASAPFCRGIMNQAEAREHEAEARAEQAEVRQREAEARAEQAEVLQREAEVLAEQAEVRQREAEVLAEQADILHHQAEVRAEQAEILQHHAEIRVEQVEVRRHEAELRAEQAEVRQHEAEIRARQAELRLHEAEIRVEQLYTSRSWRVTRPFRATRTTGRWLWEGSRSWVTLRPGTRPRRIARRCLSSIVEWIRVKPARRRVAGYFMEKIPWIATRLRASMASYRGEVADAGKEKSGEPTNNSELTTDRFEESRRFPPDTSIEMPPMSFTAIKIYRLLLRARPVEITERETH